MHWPADGQDTGSRESLSTDDGRKVNKPTLSEALLQSEAVTGGLVQVRCTHSTTQQFGLRFDTRELNGRRPRGTPGVLPGDLQSHNCFHNKLRFPTSLLLC